LTYHGWTEYSKKVDIHNRSLQNLQHAGIYRFQVLPTFCTARLIGSHNSCKKEYDEKAVCKIKNNHYAEYGSQCSQILTEKTASSITEQVIDDIMLILLWKWLLMEK
jgi:hypothetical protein